MEKAIKNIKLLPSRDYDYLMDNVFSAREALLKTLKIKKVYLIYMDETKHLHWHLVLRYKNKVFHEKIQKLKSFSLAKKIKNNLIFE